MKKIMLVCAITLGLAGCATQAPEYVDAFHDMRAAEVRASGAKARLESAELKVEVAKQTYQAKKAELAKARQDFDALYLQSVTGE